MALFITNALLAADDWSWLYRYGTGGALAMLTHVAVQLLGERRSPRGKN